MLKPLKAILKHKEVLLLICLAIISRLPQLLNQHFVVDGDEAIYGLMVKHFMEGKNVPIYFYGQTYGMVALEMPFTALFFLLFGITDFALKLSMFSLWIAAIVVHYFIFKLITKNKTQAFCIAAVMILSTMWAVWSLKARGGYPTSFLLSSILLYTLLNENIKKGYLYWIYAAASVAIIMQSQALWLVGLAPFLIYTGLKKWNIKHYLPALAVFAACMIGFQLKKQGLNEAWKPIVFSTSVVADNISKMHKIVFSYFGGSYVIHELRPVGLFPKIYAGMAILATLITMALGIKKVNLFRDNAIPFLSAISILLTFTYMFFVDGNAPRYLLPLSGFVFISVAANISIFNQGVQKVLFISFCVIGSIALLWFKDFKINGLLPSSEKQEIMASIDYLQSNDVHHVLSPPALLQWQVMFYSREDIIVRSRSLVDRVPAYIDTVNVHLLNTPPGSVAYLDYFGLMREEDQKVAVKIGERYGIILNPTKKFFKERGFDFPEDDY